MKLEGILLTGEFTSILYMQISLLRTCSICKLVDFLNQPELFIRGCSENFSWRSDDSWRLESVNVFKLLKTKNYNTNKTT